MSFKVKHRNFTLELLQTTYTATTNVLRASIKGETRHPQLVMHNAAVFRMGQILDVGGWKFPASFGGLTYTEYGCVGAAARVLLLPYCCNGPAEVVCFLRCFERQLLLLGTVPKCGLVAEFVLSMQSVELCWSCNVVEVCIGANNASKKPAMECSNLLQRPIVKLLIHNELVRNSA